MAKLPPRCYPAGDLARRIAAIHGKEAVTVKVTMVGKEEVRAYLTKVQKARSVRPSSTFRCRLAG